MKKQNYPMGSVLSGTMRPEDLIPAFWSELETQLKRGPSLSRMDRKTCIALLNDCDLIFSLRGDAFWNDSDAVEDMLNSLFDALSLFAATGFYFGSHPGDGADYGYWLSEFFVEDFDGLTVSDTGDVPKGYRGEVLHVNDHGNVTLYVASRKGLREVWGIV